MWTADFKGQFRTRNGVHCFALTIADQHTRSLLRVHGLLATRGAGERPVFERAFREYGMPLAIRTDNGVPFANTGLHGLTQLNVWRHAVGVGARLLDGGEGGVRFASSVGHQAADAALVGGEKFRLLHSTVSTHSEKLRSSVRRGTHGTTASISHSGRRSTFRERDAARNRTT